MMKRLFTTLFIALLSVTAMWAEDYGVKIGGVMLTSSNYQNITAAGGFSAVKSGTVTYDPNSRTLTLNNAVIETTSGTPAIYIPRSHYYYNMSLPEGTSSSITSEAGAGLAVEAPFTIKGGGVVTLKAPQDCGIFMDYNSSYDHILTISGCTVMASGLWGIAGNDEYGMLEIWNSLVIATGASGSVCDMKRVRLPGAVLYQPTGAVWNDASHSVCSAGGTKLTSPIIYLPVTGGSTGGGTGSLAGDVNGDGNMNIIDVTKLVNMILGKDYLHEYVDLDLPSGTLWATCNVGADTPYENGQCFMWGETTGHEFVSGVVDGFSFDVLTAPYCNGSVDAWTKYCTSSNWGAVDGKTELEPMDDAASVNWGPKWRMPTKAQVEELLDEANTSLSEMTVNGRTVLAIKSLRNNITLYFPLTGSRNGDNHNLGNEAAYIWTRSVDEGYSCNAYYVEFIKPYGSDEYGRRVRTNRRFYGFAIRPVRAQ